MQAAAKPSAALIKMDEKKGKMQVKEVFASRRRNANTKPPSSKALPKSIKIDEVYSEARV
ncbi:hypothetical protein BYT27DRAFT_6866911 [Phlegmacium glaucopus]|nr:hypothetical protein BYT27DRAFT_6866911 [Phlegmacium glaucopus]